MSYRAVAIALLLASHTTASSLTWSPCPLLTIPNPELTLDPAVAEAVECTTYKAPLCYPGECETTDSVKATSDVFVKRIRATTIPPELALNVWLVQGSAMFNPSFLDGPMYLLYADGLSMLNIYTMGNCGAGKSALLTCKDAQRGLDSPTVGSVNPSQVPECAQELEQKFGDLAAFSTTSAAKDLVALIFELGNGTTLYGVGQGTRLVERVMHLGPPEVTGYVLDGVVTTLGASPDEFVNPGTFMVDVSEVGDVILDLCGEDEGCGSHFKKKGLKATLKHLMAKLDKHPSSTCAKLAKKLSGDQELSELPSFYLRSFVASILHFPGLTFIPPIVFRLTRCAEKDVALLTHLTARIRYSAIPSRTDTATPSILNGLIQFSEEWKSPTPYIAYMREQGEAFTFGGWGWGWDEEIPRYCAYLKEKSRVCNKLKVGHYKARGIIYERDEYWNKAGKIPDQASVLIMGSEWNPIAPIKYAKSLLAALGGDKKELLTFKSTTP